jgi:hypothetical protein
MARDKNRLMARVTRRDKNARRANFEREKFCHAKKPKKGILALSHRPILMTKKRVGK